jgi:hypothetical protein
MALDVGDASLSLTPIHDTRESMQPGIEARARAAGVAWMGRVNPALDERVAAGTSSWHGIPCGVLRLACQDDAVISRQGGSQERFLTVLPLVHPPSCGQRQAQAVAPAP